VPDNVLSVSGELFAVIAGMITLIGAALVFSFKHKATSADAGEAGHRPAESEEDTERVSPDGFIDSFAGLISEAGGGMPVIGWVVIGVVLVMYVIYLFLNWVPGR
jgi:hypothetical protein